ncbi:serpin family protein [Micromonospora sp. NPDC051925]|uniref:serpin family protein n=1 Tax=Micromonospora sp. NPDC051925 TaxID=3364288 RepID=UPI0037CB0F0F
MSPYANALTARWASRLDDRQTVLSGAGVYPLLALLARYATGPARDELRAVAPAPDNPIDSPTTRLAAGLWSRAGLPLGHRWRTELDASTRGELTGDPTVDQPVLDRWAHQRTDGLITRMPVQVGPGTALVLANALTVLVDWASPFQPARCQPTTGPWQGRPLAGLHRPGGDPAALRVADTAAGPISLLTVTGDADVDVLLVLGPTGQPPARVLPAALGALDDTPTLPPQAGPGVTEETVEAYDDRPELLVRTVGFTVTGDHDLLDHADLFGLATARHDGDHFPDISPQLSISDARQSTRAEFAATGFRAAAVTTVSMRAGAASPRATVRRRRVRFDVDRPFGFLAVHRPTGLVLVTGWVNDPAPA